jgi:glycosyltransferase involved in cell wall biosynthesis
MGVSREPLVSCLCITQNRLPFLRRAVECFRNQTYQHRELVVLYQADDRVTRDYLARARGPSIRPVEVPSSPRLRLGSLRNLSLQAGSGDYVALWDDDDWHSPDRLTEQLAAIRRTCKRGCLLCRCVILDAVGQSAYVSGRRTWEMTLVAERMAVPPYADLTKGEDTPVIFQMMRARTLTFLDRPHLYVYVYHGRNTWDRSHWETAILPFAESLGVEDTERVKRVASPDAVSDESACLPEFAAAHGTLGQQLWASARRRVRSGCERVLELGYLFSRKLGGGER